MVRRIVFAVLALSLSSSGIAFAFDDAAYEASVRAELRAVSPRAESLFLLADSAAARDDNRAALDLYGRVVMLAPRATAPRRRLARARLALGDRVRAIEELREIVARDTLAFNLASLADALLKTPEGIETPPEQVMEARALARRAVAQIPDEASVRLAAARAAAFDPRDEVMLRESAAALESLVPESWIGWAMMTDCAVRSGDEALYRSSLSGADARGMPAELHGEFARLHAALAQKRDQHRMWQFGLGTLAVWIAGFLALFAIGSALSRATLAAADRALESPTGEAEGVDARLRSFYRIVLHVSGAFFYVSMPLILVLVLLIGGGLLYAMISIGHIPVKLFAIVGLATIMTVVAIVRGLFARSHDEDPGPVLELEKHPRFRESLQRVADHVGTRAVDKVFVVPDTTVAVYERGDMRAQLQGKAERCLILGIGVLEGMTVRQLKAILAHEYGHFSNRDTAGGGFALSVRRALMNVAVGIAEGGAAGWYNPAWLFVRAFHNVFMRISQGASRLQEVLADRWAAATYGSLAFEQGLVHVVSTSVRFGNTADHVINRALREKEPLPNLYRVEPAADPELEATVESELREALERGPSEFDSHPAPSQRIAWVRGYAAAGVAPEEDDDSPAWTLFEGREELESTMTAHVRERVESRHGVQFVTAPGEPAEPAPGA